MNINMKRDHVVRATATNGTIRAFAVYPRAGLVEDRARLLSLRHGAAPLPHAHAPPPLWEP